MSRNRLLSSLVALMLVPPAMAADFSDPGWPCIQRKIDTLSLGLMWQHPVPEGEITDPELARDVAELADRLAIRRLALEDLRPAVAAFAETWDGSAESLSLVLARMFRTLDTRRTRIISGIADVSLGQIALSERIDATRVAMQAELDRDDPDFDKVDDLEEQLDWDQVIYSDRQRSVTYLCESPQLIEKRIFNAARLLAEFVRD